MQLGFTYAERFFKIKITYFKFQENENATANLSTTMEEFRSNFYQPVDCLNKREKVLMKSSFSTDKRGQALSYRCLEKKNNIENEESKQNSDEELLECEEKL